MEYKQEHLQNLLTIVEKVCADEKNNWLKEELQKKFNFPVANTGGNEFLQKVFGRKFRSDGNIRYKGVFDIKLRQELSNYYKKMRLGFLTGDYVTYGRCVILQLEAIFSYLCEKVYAWNVILIREHNNPIMNRISTSTDPNWPPTNIYMAFINSDGSFKSVSEVNFAAKAAFCLDYYQIQLIQNWTNMNNLYKVRNFDAHAKITSKDRQKALQVIEQLPSKIGFYEMMLSQFSSCINKFFSETA